jgi:F0F1-type ATP synthase epsilon subunit
MKRGKIRLLVMDREAVLFDDEVETVSSTNEKGVFDVLEEHTNFISLIRDTLTVHLKNGEVTEIPVVDAIMRVYDDGVYVFMGLGH